MEKSEKEIILVTDGGYDGQDNIALAGKRLGIITLACAGFSPTSSGRGKPLPM